MISIQTPDPNLSSARTSAPKITSQAQKCQAVPAGRIRNALRRAVFFHRQGEFRDRTFENQGYRASGLSLLTAAIVHWNTIYLDRAVQQLRSQGAMIPDELLVHVAPLGWEHIALTGDYDWNTARPTDGLRPLRSVPQAFTQRAA